MWGRGKIYAPIELRKERNLQMVKNRFFCALCVLVASILFFSCAGVA